MFNLHEETDLNPAASAKEAVLRKYADILLWIWMGRWNLYKWPFIWSKAVGFVGVQYIEMPCDLCSVWFLFYLIDLMLVGLMSLS